MSWLTYLHEQHLLYILFCFSFLSLIQHSDSCSMRLITLYKSVSSSSSIPQTYIVVHAAISWSFYVLCLKSALSVTHDSPPSDHIWSFQTRTLSCSWADRWTYEVQWPVIRRALNDTVIVVFIMLVIAVLCMLQVVWIICRWQKRCTYQPWTNFWRYSARGWQL